MPRIWSRYIEEERVMEKTIERREDDVIDLGAASVETKGQGFVIADDGGQQNLLGLADD
jgi:hypothetical protein